MNFYYYNHGINRPVNLDEIIYLEPTGTTGITFYSSQTIRVWTFALEADRDNILAQLDALATTLVVV